MVRIEICLSNDSKKTLFVSKNKREHCLFSMYLFLTHGPFISLRNFSLVSNKATKTLTTQKSIIWWKSRSLQSFGLRRWCTMLAALRFQCGLGSFPFLLETNNAFRVVTQTYFKSDHTINFCVGKVFMVLLETKIKFLKLMKWLWVRNDYIPNEQHFILLLETNNVSLCC